MARTVDLKSRKQAAADDPLILQLPFGDFTVVTSRSRSIIRSIKTAALAVENLSDDADPDEEAAAAIGAIAPAIVEDSFEELAMSEWRSDRLDGDDIAAIASAVAEELGGATPGEV